MTITVEPSVVSGLPSAASVKIEYFPNPTNGVVQLRSTRFAGAAVQLNLVNMRGQQVPGRLQRLSPTVLRLDMSDLPAGAYRGVLWLDGEGSVLQLLKE